ncbi:MAG: glycerate kinase [Actinomycetes bacterium]
MARIVIAPDSFKGSASNSDVAQWIGEGWLQVRPHDEIIYIPMADGGEGTITTIANVREDVEKSTLSVIGADGRTNRAYWILLDDGTAIVELANASGITLVEKLDALSCHTYGLGQVLNEARRHPEVERIFIALGGSASTDGGTGALRALGFSFLDSMGDEIELGGAGLNELAEIDSSNFLHPPKGGVTCMVDVSNPLLGPLGAAAIFGPQKGATAEDVATLETGLQQFMKVCKVEDAPGSGAAGGTAYGMRAGWGAKYVSGAASVATFVGLPEAIAVADLVITGEGRLDSQSWSGKVVGYVRQLSGALGKPVGYCVGSQSEDFPNDAFGGVSLVALAGSGEEAMDNTRHWVVQAGIHLAQSQAAAQLS